MEFERGPPLEELSSFSKMLWVCVWKRQEEARRCMLGKGGENKPFQGKPIFSSLEKQATDTEDLPFLTKKKTYFCQWPLCFSLLLFLSLFPYNSQVSGHRGSNQTEETDLSNCLAMREERASRLREKKFKRKPILGCQCEISFLFNSVLAKGSKA